jgi:hypothetical protein
LGNGDDDPVPLLPAVQVRQARQKQDEADMKLEVMHLLPDEDNPKSIRNWRIRVFIVGCSSSAVLCFFVLPALLGFPYAIPKLGAVVWAADIDKKIEDAMSPIEADNLAIKQNLESLNAQTKINQSFLIEGQIQAAQSAWCESNKRGIRAPIAAQRIDELKRQYQRLTGEAPYIPTCQQV